MEKTSSLIVKPAAGSLDGRRHISRAMRMQLALSSPEIRKRFSWLCFSIGCCSSPSRVFFGLQATALHGYKLLAVPNLAFFPLHLAGCKDMKFGGMPLCMGWGHCSRGDSSEGCVNSCFWIGTLDILGRGCYFFKVPLIATRPPHVQTVVATTWLQRHCC